MEVPRLPLVSAACALRACGDACLEPGCECECHTAPRPQAELLALQAELSEPGWVEHWRDCDCGDCP